jgi:hypothetical protein
MQSFKIIFRSAIPGSIHPYLHVEVPEFSKQVSETQSFIPFN